MTDEKQTIHFHIGAHKTASSFLQANLRASNDGLAQHGLGVVFRRDVVSTAFAKELHKVAQKQHAPDAVSGGARKSLRRLVRKFDGDVLVANEDLVCRLNVQDFYQNIEDSIAYIRNTLPEYDLHFILYIRKQPDYLESVYMQYVHLGRTLKFERFMERAAVMDLSWLRVVEGIAAVAGPQNVSVRPFETIRDMGEDRFLQQFLELCGVQDVESFTAADVARSRASNRSYSGLAMKIARHAGPFLESKKDRNVFRKFLQENFSTATHARAELLDPAARQEIFERYAASNRTLFRRYDLGGAAGDALGYY